jgi:hypothetical protein
MMGRVTVIAERQEWEDARVHFEPLLCTPMLKGAWLWCQEPNSIHAKSAVVADELPPDAQQLLTEHLLIWKPEKKVPFF